MGTLDFESRVTGIILKTGLPRKDAEALAAEEIKAEIRQRKTENKRATEQATIATASANKPMTTTERNTLLTIIAALCDYSDIKHQARGTATQIAGFTVDIGAPVTDDTIRKVLAQIPNALETRMK